jgi:manganese/zinc/iron transport system permease protein
MPDWPMTDLQSFLQIDLPAILAAVLACFSCALVGNYTATP